MKVQTLFAGADKPKAKLYRMVMPKHLCPWGVRSKDLLRRKGFEVEDHWLTTKEETQHFKDTHGVTTTPQTFINGERVGGYEALEKHFNEQPKKRFYTAYKPVIAIFTVAALMALSVTFGLQRSAASALMWFMGFALSFLAVQKLQDVRSFVNQFVGYDLVAQKRVAYAKAYPFIEALLGLGVLMLAAKGSLPALVLLVLSLPMTFMGVVGGYSVFKAVYLEKRELKCACVGGGTDVPLGFVSFMENLIMVLMGGYMLLSLA